VQRQRSASCERRHSRLIVRTSSTPFAVAAPHRLKHSNVSTTSPSPRLKHRHKAPRRQGVFNCMPRAPAARLKPGLRYDERRREAYDNPVAHSEPRPDAATVFYWVLCYYRCQRIVRHHNAQEPRRAPAKPAVVLHEVRTATTRPPVSSAQKAASSSTPRARPATTV